VAAAALLCADMAGAAVHSAVGRVRAFVAARSSSALGASDEPAGGTVLGNTLPISDVNEKFGRDKDQGNMAVGTTLANKNFDVIFNESDLSASVSRCCFVETIF